MSAVKDHFEEQRRARLAFKPTPDQKTIFEFLLAELDSLDATISNMRIWGVGEDKCPELHAARRHVRHLICKVDPIDAMICRDSDLKNEAADLAKVEVPS